jgi:hypothetical protein
MQSAKGLSRLGLLWLGIAIISVVPTMVLGFMLLTLYSAGWLHGFEPALALETLLLLQTAVAITLGVRMARGRNDTVVAAAAGLALACLYAPVTAPAPRVRGEWIVIAPLAALSVAVAMTFGYGIATWLVKIRRHVASS